MSEVLSQSEIDALLNALSEGDEEVAKSNTPQKVRAYDFRRPNKFSKGHLISLSNIYEHFARSLASYLSGNIHMVVDAKVLSSEQLTFDEFLRSLPYPSILGVVNMQPLVGSALIEMAPTLAYIIIECLLGGQGKGVVLRNHDLTEIEQKIITSRMLKITELMEEAWTETFSLTPQLTALETNPQFAQIVAPNEMVVLITLEVNVSESTGLLNICLPYVVIKPILDNLDALYLFASAEEKLSDEDAAVVRKRIEQTEVSVRAFVGGTKISVQEFLALELGDVIPLNQHIQGMMSVYVGKYLKFMAVPGLSGDRLAVQIVDVIRDGGGDTHGQ
ncbi:MAG: flagellar motor switch protein FliM [Peptococcaceae bacterium]|nr:flagellar motor switch protein FliM [Peptococcaceae bacterium]